MYLKLGRVRVHFSFLFALFTAFAANSEKGEYLTTVFSGALIHECAHLCFLLSYGVRGIGLELDPGGAKITGAGIDALPYKKALICILAGPAANLALGGALFAVSFFLKSEGLERAAFINFSLGAVNLIPLSFLDGGRALKCLISIKKHSPGPYEAAGRTDIAITVLLFFFAVALTVKNYDATFVFLFTGYCALNALSRRYPR